MLDQIKSNYDEAGKAYTEAKSIFDNAKDGQMSAEDNQRWNALMDVFDTKSARARDLERMYEANRRMSTVDESRRLPNLHDADATNGQKADSRSLETKAFDAYLHGNVSDEFKAALNIGTDSQGGYLTPTEYADQIVKGLENASVMRLAGAHIIPLTSDSLKVPRLSGAVAAVLTSEGQNYDEKEPTLDEVTFVPYKYTRLAKASDEVVADSRFPIWNAILKDQFTDGFSLAENDAFTTGTGSGQPEGVLTAATQGVVLPNGTTQTANITSADSLIELYHALDFKYRARATWMMNDAILKIVRKLKDTTGQYIWQPALASGQPETILSRPVINNPSMPAAAAGARTILFGDFSYYWIGDREGLQIKMLQELYSGQGQIGFRAFKRFDGHLMLPVAMQYLKQAAS